MLSPNLAQFASFGRLPVVEEGRLVAHELAGEGTWDLHVLAVHLEPWCAFRRAGGLEVLTRALAEAIARAANEERRGR